MQSSVAPERFRFRVVEKRNVSPSVVRLRLMPADERHMPYAEGQFLSIQLPDGQSRCYSMARPAMADGLIELHVRVHPGGLFSDRALAGLAVGAELVALGPFGDCVWKQWNGPTLMLAVGTGVAPLNAIIERLAANGHHAPVHLYWGARTADELYLAPHFHNLAQRLPWFRFVPVLERAPVGGGYRQGFVQDHAVDDFDALDQAQVYACGIPAMIDAARQLLIAKLGLSPERFHADPFDPPAAAGTAMNTGLPVPIVAVDAEGREHAVTARAGATLMTALKSADAPLLSVCGGKKSCGTCRVEVDPEHFHRLPAADRDEMRLLAALDDPQDRHRLACQVILSPALAGLRVSLSPQLP